MAYIDPFLKHQIDFDKEDAKIHYYAFLMKVKNPGDTFLDVPDLVITSTIQDIYSCQGSSETITALVKNSKVISIEGAREISNE